MRNIITSALVAAAVAAPLSAAAPSPVAAPSNTAEVRNLQAAVTDLQARVYTLEQFRSCLTRSIAWQDGQPLVKWKRHCAGLDNR